MIYEFYRRHIIKKKNLKFFLLILFLFACSNNNVSERPNIIFIMSDDHAVPAVSSYDGFLSNVF